MAAAAVRAGRDPASVRIIAVSKRHSAERIAEAHAAGVTEVGENYAQEMIAKQDELAGRPQLADLAWHFIGRLQRNKARYVVGRAALIHAVDSETLAGEIDKRAALAGIVQPILIAVSAAGESQKTGVAPESLGQLLERVGQLEHVSCRGLMTMPPWPDDPEDSRPYYAALRATRDSLRTDAMPLAELSMGTSGDLEVAVEEGATFVRVGTAIFGPRPAP